MEITGAMKSIVECPICLQIPNGNVFLCENSHKVCVKCFSKLEEVRCPQGKCEYRCPNPFRYVALEEIIENCFEVACNHDGCKVVLKAAEMRTHEEDCPRRLVPCFLDKDCDQVALEDMPDHLSDTHGSKFCIYGGRVEGNAEINGELFLDALVRHFKIRDECFGPYQFSFDGHRFFHTIAILDNVWFSWLSVNAGKRVAERYKATLSYTKLDLPFSIEATMPVSAVDVYWKEVLKSGHCLQINAGQMSVLMTEGEKVSADYRTTHLLFFEFEVRRLNAK